MNISLNQKIAKYIGGFVMLVTLALSGGCATYSQQTTGSLSLPPPPALSVGDIGKMVTDKRIDPEIIAEIQSKGLKAAINANDLDLLQKAGASKEVIDAVLSARVAPVYQPQTTTVTQYGYAYPPVWGGLSYGLGLGWGWSNYRYRYHAPRYHGSVGVRRIR